MKKPIENYQPSWLSALENGVFASRWLQAPMYLGLILAQGLYVYKFLAELVHLFWNITTLQETDLLLAVLGLVDVVMVANLIYMVVVGGWETFVSRLYIDTHPDKPDWLNHVDAGVLKIKLAVSLVTISSIHLLKSFINAENMKTEPIVYQLAIHLTFLLSAIVLAYTEKIMKDSHVSAR